MIQKASSLKEIYNCFEPKALTEDQKHFYQQTAAVRVGMSAKSDVKPPEYHEKLLNRINISVKNSHILLVGHGGCGKSTELRMLAGLLRDKGISPIFIDARDEVNVKDFSIVDISMLIVEHLAKYAHDNGYAADKRIISAFEKAISTTTMLEYWEREKDVEFNAEASGTIKFLGFLNLMSRITTYLKSGSGFKEQFKREIDPKKPDIVQAVNAFLEDLNRQILKKRNISISERGISSNIVIIIDGLEKCSKESVNEFFTFDSSILSTIESHMVIACPINVYRSSTAEVLRSFFPPAEMIPTIKTHKNDLKSSPHREGIKVIYELILKRVDAKFFEKNVLERIIVKAGGSLRHTCYLIRDSAFEALMRGRESVDIDSVNFVIRNFAKELFLSIDYKYYQKVKEIYDGNHEITSDNDIAGLLYVGAVFEYNGNGWIDLHPLIRDYIKDHPRVLD